MSIDKFRFVSPGVQVAEIDQSRRTRPAADPGPVIIGRFERGPTMRPTKIDSLNELEEIFGRTITGRESGDISRNGNYSAPSYAAFAANAWLANNGGATIVRLVGKHAESKEATGKAGWTVTATDGASGRGGAWGLWVLPSASAKDTMTGTLGAIFYCAGDTGVTLSGSILGGADISENAATAFKFSDGKIRARVRSPIGHASNVAGTVDDDQMFNFNPSSRLFIRKVFNTTPHSTNTNVTKAADDSYKRYWLGETFEDRVQEMIANHGDGSNLIAWTAPLVSGSSTYYDHQIQAQPSKTGWVIAQDESANHAAYLAQSMQKLFRVVSLEEGEWTQRSLKISIRNIRLPNVSLGTDGYGSFDLVVRKIRDTDAAPDIVETFTGLDLNPASPNYIAARIGDQSAVWTDTEKRYRYFGAYPNQSKYIRVEMAPAVDEGSITNSLVPFGFYGMPKPAGITLSGYGADGTGDHPYIQSASGSALTVGGNGLGAVTNQMLHMKSIAGAGAQAITASLSWPSHRLVVSSSDLSSLAEPNDRFFGVDFSRHNTAAFNEAVFDIAKTPLSLVSSDTVAAWDKAASMIDSEIFSLDDLKVHSSGLASDGYNYVSGSRALGTSKTATGGSAASILDLGYDKFTMALYGGFDGLDVTEMEPMINNDLVTGKTVTDSYEKYTLIRSLDTVADPEITDMNLLTMPGIYESGITNYMINTVERRRDAMAVIDLKYAYTPRHESNEPSEATRNNVASNNTVTKAVVEQRSRGFNSSYGACYYPWVQVAAPVTGLPTWVPPSVVALGAMSYGEATQAVWFAPAGFTRGGLTEGRGGLPVSAVSQRLSSKERDSLYEVNINPIAQFPAEGIVIFGQKTLQAVPSALDRINVRRLLIFIKKRISTIAATLLFQPNVSTTWASFTSQVSPFLQSVKSGFGLEDFKVVLDSTTTTADLVDRNTLYAKIYVKPTKAIEFIAIDFVITNQGASFDD